MIPFSPPRIDQKIIDEVIDTLKSGWITTGPKTKLFEKRLSEFTGAPATLCVNSATAGLELMLSWFGVKEGDEVILPAYTYSATANVIIHRRAKPVFVDVLDDFNIDPEKVKNAITSRTKVIMPVDFGGWPCNYDALNSIVSDPAIKKMFVAQNDKQEMLGRIMIISDAAHSLGAIYHGRHSGSLTDCSVFSFHAVKNLTTAEGGAVCLNLPEPFQNESEYSSLCITSLHGQNKDALEKLKKGNWKYDVVEAGYKINMTDIHASIGLVELSRYRDETLPRRKEICERYRNAFQNQEWAIVPPLENINLQTSSSYHLFALRVRGIDEQNRDSIIQKIAERSVSVNVHFIPVPMMSFYKNLGYKISDYPLTYRNYECEISLPVYYDLTNPEVDTVIETVIKCVNDNLKNKE